MSSAAMRLFVPDEGSSAIETSESISPTSTKTTRTSPRNESISEPRETVAGSFDCCESLTAMYSAAETILDLRNAAAVSTATIRHRTGHTTASEILLKPRRLLDAEGLEQHVKERFLSR